VEEKGIRDNGWETVRCGGIASGHSLKLKHRKSPKDTGKAIHHNDAQAGAPSGAESAEQDKALPKLVLKEFCL